MLKAFVGGIGVIFVVYWLWILDPWRADSYRLFGLVLPLTEFLIISPALAALLAALLTPRWKLAVGISMTIPASFFRPPSLLQWFYYKAVGFPGEAWGFKETLLMTVQYLELNTVLCAVGALLGWILSWMYLRLRARPLN
jgi:hypothetical protein